MATNPQTVARQLIEKRFESFTGAPITFPGDGNVVWDPSIQKFLNTSSDSPAGIQPVSGWTVANVRSTNGYVQCTVEFLEGDTLGLTAGLSGAAMQQPEVLRMIARFAVVSPSARTDAAVEEIFRQIRVLYERTALYDSTHADWPALQVRNLPLGGSGTPWREVLERDIDGSWRYDRITGEFETSPVLQPWASSTGAPIDVDIAA